MKLQAYSIFDQVAGVYAQPAFYNHDKLALRDFITLANDPNTQVSLNPADFSICHVGDFDQDLGIFTAKEPQIIANAANLQIKNQEPANEVSDEASVQSGAEGDDPA